MKRSPTLARAAPETAAPTRAPCRSAVVVVACLVLSGERQVVADAVPIHENERARCPAGFQVAQLIGSLLRRRDRLLVDRLYDVADLDAEFGGRTLVGDTRDSHAVHLLRDTELL